MKNKTLQRVAVFALVLVMACSAMTGCTGSKKTTGTQKPATSQSEQQKPGNKKPGNKKPSQSETKSDVNKIEKTATDKLVDTYTITFKDKSTTSFTVTYDNDGKKINKIESAADKNGKAHVVEIKNGVWCIDGESTGIKATDIRAANDGNVNKKPDIKKPGKMNS